MTLRIDDREITTKTFIDRWGLYYLVTCSVLTSLLSLVLPLSILIIFDRIVPNQTQTSLSVLYVIIIGSIILDSHIKKKEKKYIYKIASAFEIVLNRAIFNSLLNAQFFKFNQKNVGEYMEHIRNIDAIKDFYTGEMIGFSVNIGFCSMTLIIVTLIDMKLGLTLILCSILVIIRILFLNNKQRDLLIPKSEFEGRANTKIEEFISAPKCIKAQSMEYRLERSINKLINARDNITARLEVVSSDLTLTITAMTQIAVSVIVAQAAIAVIAFEISQGIMAGIIMLVNRYFSPLQQIIQFHSRWTTHKEQVAQLQGIIDLGRQSHQAIELDYPSLISLRIRQHTYSFKIGSTYCITGPETCGKSKFLNALMNPSAHPAQPCELVLDRTTCSSRHLEYWKNLACVIDRHTGFVDGNLVDNLTCFDQSLYSAAYTLCEAFGVKHIVDVLPQGFYTQMSAGSSTTVSRQILYTFYIIRAMLSNKRYIFLDDIDLVADSLLIQNLTSGLIARKSRMIIVFASMNPAIIQECDKVYRIDELREEILWLN